MISVWHGSLIVNWRYDYECISIVSSRRLERPRRTLDWLSQFVCTAQLTRGASVDRRLKARIFSVYDCIHSFTFHLNPDHT